MSFLSDLLKTSFPLILKVVKALADSQIDGATLNKDQKQALYSGYVVINTWFDDLVESTENEYDNAGLEVLSDFCADKLAEAGIVVPDIPDELLESPPKDEE